MPKHAYRRPAVAVAITASAIAATIAFASSSGSPSAAKVPVASSTSQSARTDPDPKLVGAYGVLRGSSNVAQQANNPFERSHGSAVSVDPDQARFVETGGNEYWVAASSEVLCLRVHAVSSGVITGGCRPTEGAEREGFFTGSSPAPGSPGANQTRIAALLPDGVTDVEITSDAGRTTRIEVNTNILDALIAGPASARFVTPDGKTVVQKL